LDDDLMIRPGVSKFTVTADERNDAFIVFSAHGSGIPSGYAFAIECKDWSQAKEQQDDVREEPPPSDDAQPVDHLNVKVYAFACRTDYNTPTWNDEGDEVYRKAFVELKDKTVGISIWPSTWDDYHEVLWNSYGAKSPPKAGTTPLGIERSMLLFDAGENPGIGKVGR
jgi:hypothetical protein